MAIAFGGFADGDNFGGSTTTITITSPSVSGSDTLALVAVSIRGSSQTVTGVTWNGVSMTLVPSSSITANNYLTVLYYLTSPSSGATTVVVSGTNFTRAFATANYYTGVDQTTPVLDVSTSSNTDTSGITGSFTLTNNDMYIHEVMSSTLGCTSPTLSAGTRTSARCDGSGTSGFGYQGPLASGSQTMVWSDGTSDHTRSGIGINPVAAAATTVHRLLMMGCGV